MNNAFKFCYLFLADPKKAYFKRNNQDGKYAKCYYDITTFATTHRISTADIEGLIHNLFSLGVIGFCSKPSKTISSIQDVGEIIGKIGQGQSFIGYRSLFTQTYNIIFDDWIYETPDYAAIKDQNIAACLKQIDSAYKGGQ